MKLSDIILQYRTEHNYSIREFAKLCDLSHVQLYFMERGANSKGQPFTPTVPSLQKLSHGMGITFNELVSICEDLSEFHVPQIDKSKLSPANRALVAWAIDLPPDKAAAWCKAFGLPI